MQQVRLIEISAEEFSEIIHAAVRKEIPALVTQAINKALATPVENRLIPRKEAMSLLGVRTRDTMIKLEKQGDLTPVKIGNRTHYSLTDIQQFKKDRS